MLLATIFRIVIINKIIIFVEMKNYHHNHEIIITDLQNLHVGDLEVISMTHICCCVRTEISKSIDICL